METVSYGSPRGNRSGRAGCGTTVVFGGKVDMLVAAHGYDCVLRLENVERQIQKRNQDIQRSREPRGGSTVIRGRHLFG